MFWNIPLKAYFLPIILLSIVSITYLVYNYYVDTQLKIENLIKSNTVYENAVKTTNQTLEIIKKDAEKMQLLNNELQKKLQDAEKYKDELSKKLNKHNLTILSQKKPGLIEKRINDATTKIFKDLEDITALPTSIK